MLGLFATIGLGTRALSAQRQGIETANISNADFVKLLAAENEKVRQIVRLSGVKPE